MFKRLVTIIVAVTLALSMAGSAFATFQDLELIRVYYDRNGAEIATDLGKISDLVNSTTPASTPTTTIDGSFGSLSTGYVVYFALDRANFGLWASNSTTTAPLVIGGSLGLTSINSGTTVMYNLFNTQGGTDYTGLASHNNSYKNKLSSTQGWLANTITGVAARAATELSIATLATNNTQTLYYWSNAKALTADIAGRTGVAVATITTNADGSTTISAPPAAAIAPGKPLTITAEATGDGKAKVTFAPPESNGGSDIASYTVTAVQDSNLTSTGTASPITVSGLTNGTAYTFTVKATNEAGLTGPASDPSNSVTPTSTPAPPTAPGAPTNVSATSGNTEATVAFTAPSSTGGSPITSYTVTSSPGGITASGAASPITVIGLLNGTAYTFTVTATNEANLTSLASAPTSPAVTPAAPTAPGAPVIGTATAGNTQATVAFTAPSSTGGSPITSYTVTSSPGGITASGTTSPITVIGLINGTAYTFTVKATNADLLTGPSSNASNSVTPNNIKVAPGAPVIGTATAGNADATVAFTAPASTGSGPITSYTVTSVQDATKFASGTDSPIKVTGLTNGTAYTFTVIATNSDLLTGPASTASNSVTPIGAPGVPTGVTAVGGNRIATVTFAVPASNGGSPITLYTVTSVEDKTKTATGTASPIIVTGLTNGTAYTFTVTAKNSALFTSPASASSNSVVPAVPPIMFTVTTDITVTPSDVPHGSITPATGNGVDGKTELYKTASFTVQPDSGYQIASVTGCNGSLIGNTYTTGAIISNCTVTASFIAAPAVKGDLNSDGLVTIADALVAMRITAGLITPTAGQIAAAPIGAAYGKINIADVVAILQKTVGLVNW